jgi:hypothetical protein
VVSCRPPGLIGGEKTMLLGKWNELSVNLHIGLFPLILICLSQYASNYAFHLTEYESLTNRTKLKAIAFIVHNASPFYNLKFFPLSAIMLNLKRELQQTCQQWQCRLNDGGNNL